MRKLLWVGDAGCETGFAKATHNTLDTLRETWEVHVLGLHFKGDGNVAKKYPYMMYPAATVGTDIFGLRRLPEMVGQIKPDVVVVQNDPWNIPKYVKYSGGQVPMIGAIAVDGLNCRGRALNGLALAIFWTQFGMNEARKGGYEGPAAVVPLGVDLNTFEPRNKRESRMRAGLPEAVLDSYIIGCIGRNQPRKRIDLTMRYFAKWMQETKSDAYLYLHVAPTGESGYDILQLAEYYGITNRLILSEPEAYHGIQEHRLVDLYNCWDVQISTTQGEGWGLCTLEGMACGIPQIVPDWSALGEWAKPAAMTIPCTSTAVTTGNINVVGGVADERATIIALTEMYTRPELRKYFSNLGMELAAEDDFRWSNIGSLFNRAIEEALEHRVTVVSQRKDTVFG